MVLFPPCKINLGLRITRKRPDGYHDLETFFYPVPLKDALEMLPSSASTLRVTGSNIPGDPSNNLCLRAHALLSADFPEVRPVDMYLHKAIPIGAGLGGGSADGAFALVLLNRLFQLGLSREQLLPYAAKLGSDCPFFLYDGPCMATGRGELLRPADLNLSAYRLVLVNPGIHVDTGWAFGQVTPLAGDSLVLPPVGSWKNILRNELEPAVVKAHPEVGYIKEALYGCGAVYASMSGSGSTVYGFFLKAAALALPEFPVHYWVKTL